MVFEKEPYIVYVKNNDFNYITAVNSSAFLADTADWIEIDSGYGDRYVLAQGNYFEKPIMTESGAYRYKLVDGKALECTAEDVLQQTQNKEILRGVTLEDRVRVLEKSTSEVKELLDMIIGKRT